MKNSIYYLSTCDTCKRIMNQIDNIDRFTKINIKKEAITSEELAQIKELAGISYEELFSKRSRKYKDIKDSLIGANDNIFAEHIIQEYTFLKRPVIIYDDQVFFGNSKKTIEPMLTVVNKL